MGLRSPMPQGTPPGHNNQAEFRFLVPGQPDYATGSYLEQVITSIDSYASKTVDHRANMTQQRLSFAPN